MADPRLYDMLKNPDAAKRKLAIQALARSKDPEAIPYLERVVDYDDDDSLRDLAEKAIVYINRNTQSATPSAPVEAPRQAASSPSPIGGDGGILDQYAEAGSSGGFVRVSQSEEDRARRLLGSGLDFNMRGHNLKAVKAVVDAFKANPNLKDDGYARGVASTVTGLHVGEAVEKVMDGSALEIFDPKAKNKAKRDGSGGSPIGELPTRDKDGREAGEETEVGFGSALLDLFIYGLVNAVVIGGGLLLLFYLVIDALPPALFSEPIAPGVPTTIGDVIAIFNSIGVTILLLYSALYGVLQMVALFFQTAIIHWAATTFMKGEGTLSNLLHRLSVFYTILVPVSIVLPFIGGFIAGGVSTNAQQGFEAGQNIGNILTLGVTVYTIWGTSVRIGKNYAFGTGNGCLSLLLGSVALGVLCCIIIYGLSYAMASSIDPTTFITSP